MASMRGLKKSAMAGLLTAVVAVAAADKTEAALITADLLGTVTSSTNAAVDIGDSWTGSLVFETGPDANPDAQIGSYNPIISSASFTLGSDTLNGTSWNASVADNFGKDYFTGSFNTAGQIGGVETSLLAFSQSGDMSTLTSDNLFDALVQDTYNLSNQFTFIGAGGKEFSGDFNFANARELPVSVVPLPATLPFFVVGIVVLGFAGRRRRKGAVEKKYPLNNCLINSSLKP